jgi:hypothetical protein
VPVGKTIYVILSPQTTIKEAVNTYFHEAYHVTRDIIEYLEIDDDEAEAYLHGYIAEYFHDFMYKCK